MSIASHTPKTHTAYFRFYEELNDFLPKDKQKRTFAFKFRGTPSIKDTIEAIGVPHTEIDLILINGESISFDFQLHGGEQISVYPVFESLDISPLIKLRPEPLRHTRFIADVHLGTLARKLRLLGFDTLYQNNYSDPEIIQTAHKENRIILTRDKGILKHSIVTHGYWVRSSDPQKQIREIIKRFQLENKFKPLTRCSNCNTLVVPVNIESARNRIPEGTLNFVTEFKECPVCNKVFWKGSHYEKILEFIQGLKRKPETESD